MELVVALVNRNYDLGKITSRYAGYPVLVAGKVEVPSRIFEHIKSGNSIIVYDPKDSFDYEPYMKYALKCGKEVEDIG